MNMKSAIYDKFPDAIQPFVKSAYYYSLDAYERQYRKIHPYRKTDSQLHSEFIDEFFNSRTEYQEYVDEFEQGPVAEIRDEALEKYQQLTGKDAGMGTIGLDTGQDYYAVTRKLKPTTLIETGVCNGLSTLSILLALQKNEKGNLYSIDHPFKSDESLEEFRKETFQDYGGAAIPSDKEPGWIIPDELRSRWDLTIGKSQRELPHLVTDLETIDLFVHDSEHSHPCMMFEYELAYEWLDRQGIILSDDITWNEAFFVFTEVRKPQYGKLSNDVGYMFKNK